MESVLLDTSIWIDALRGKTPNIVALTQGLLNDDRALTCGPVIFEIKRGLRSPERKKILPLFDALIRLSFDEAMWDAAGDLDASLRKKGVTIPPMDVLIAQICLHHKVALFTLDEHFRLVPGLQVFEPQ
ncbi:MAG: PIN domain-containing protein [Candidatus Desulfatibia sp.]|uniref:PIN domain-containing protein n=1 Tax=Candidatus Desulfatibia sp. TaxID=3101189 RepID=UPI002F2DD356